MNILKKNGGFTLVELIVVIAILAILAGVAVPAYSGYIKSANEAADQQKLEAVETAMIAALSLEGKNQADYATYFTITSGTSKVTIAEVTITDGNDVWDNFVSFYGLDSTATTVDITFDYYTGVTVNTTTGVITGTDPA